MYEIHLFGSGEMALTFESRAESLTIQWHKLENNNGMYPKGMEW
jgi:hypothetical protein